MKYYYNYDDEYHHVYETISYSCGYCSEPLGFDDDWYYEYHDYSQGSTCAVLECGWVCGHEGNACIYCEHIEFTVEDAALISQWESAWLAAYIIYSNPNISSNFREDAFKIMTASEGKTEMLKDTYRGGGTLAIYAGLRTFTNEKVGITLVDGHHSWLIYTTSKGQFYVIETAAREIVTFKNEITYVIDVSAPPGAYTTAVSVEVNLSGSESRALLDFILGYAAYWNTHEGNCVCFAAEAWAIAGQLSLEHIYKNHGHSSTLAISIVAAYPNSCVKHTHIYDLIDIFYNH